MRTTTEACIIESTRKLAIWSSITFKHIVTHEELEPIMSILGFIIQPDKNPINGVIWKEYFHPSWSSLNLISSPPIPRLPCFKINGFHIIDGLHVYTFQAFCDAVNYYLRMDSSSFSDLFHVRAVPLTPMTDRTNRFRRMDVDDCVYVYKEGTLDQDSYNKYHSDKNNDDCSNEQYSSNNIRDKGKTICIGPFVSLQDLIVPNNLGKENDF